MWNDSRLEHNLTCIGDIEDNTWNLLWKPSLYIFYASSFTPVKGLIGNLRGFIKGPKGFSWWFESNQEIMGQYSSKIINAFTFG
jgi:hypothetical protein